MSRHKYSTRFEIHGELVCIGDLETYYKGFRIRRLLVEAASSQDRYSNVVEVCLLGDKALDVDGLRQGMHACVSGNLCGGYRERDGRQYHYNTLSVTDIREEV